MATPKDKKTGARPEFLRPPYRNYNPATYRVSFLAASPWNSTYRDRLDCGFGVIVGPKLMSISTTLPLFRLLCTSKKSIQVCSDWRIVATNLDVSLKVGAFFDHDFTSL